MNLFDTLNGKKLTISASVAAIALVWSLVSPATAPSEESLMQAVQQGQDVVQVVKAHQENPVPKIIALLGTLAALASGLHKDSKLGRALWIAGQLSGRFMDHRDLKDPVAFVADVKTAQAESATKT